MEDIWRVWSISARHLDLRVHKLNREHLKRGLLSPQIARWLSEFPVVPSTANMKWYQLYDRLCWYLSYHRGCATMLCRHLGLSSLQTALGSMLISAKRWIIQMYRGTLPCTMSCDQYPELSSHTRHGHIKVLG